METRTIGTLEVSLAGLGCNNFGSRVDADGAAAVVDAALAAGVTFFDTADIYGGGRSEEFLARALGSRRGSVVVATKFGMGDGVTLPAGASAASVAAAAEGSLRRMGTDYIDLYQLHRPDDATPIEETLEAMDRLVQQGKVREIGCSNFGSGRLDEAAAAALRGGTARFASVQDELSLLHRDEEADVVQAAGRLGISILPYFPLAAGMLTGKYRRGEPPPAGTRLANVPPHRQAQSFTERRFAIVEGLEAFAAERGHTLLELAMCWLAGVPQLASVIAGATRPEQVQANAAALGWILTEAERAEVDRITG
ncbi:MAG TPA: aldo/keto reductase [Actinomycetota bacterium]|nr:aldo/keto reductase [Actinomycetota bacterium]